MLPAGGETTLFKQFFSNWKDKHQTTGPGKAYTVGRIARVEQIPFDASSLHSNKAMAAQHGMVDDGSGKVEVSQNTCLLYGNVLEPCFQWDFEYEILIMRIRIFWICDSDALTYSACTCMNDYMIPHMIQPSCIARGKANPKHRFSNFLIYH